MNNNPMSIYVSRLAEEARRVCDENNLIRRDQYALDDNVLRGIVEFFGGRLVQVDHISSQKNGNDNKFNSIMIKDGEASFRIEYVHYSSLDVLHELGHVFLEFDNMAVGDERLIGDSDGGLSELGASKFARTFLMPMHLFQNMVVDYSTGGVCDIERIATAFDVDVTQVICRGREVYSWE